MFRPDSALVAAVRPSPNHGERIGATAPDAIILHYTGMANGTAALARLRDPASEVSAHYVVELDGAILQLVPEDRRAWHAGRSCWKGRTDINSISIGIEIVNGGHNFGLPPYPDRQIAAVTSLCLDVASRHRIRRERILAHSDVAPGRKQDPGELFPWERLHAAGVGLWLPEQAGVGEAVAQGDDGPEVAAFRDGLAAFGYDLGPGSRFDEKTRIVVEAFQRHFRRSRVDGIADPGTRATLAALIAAA